jgi:integrase
LMRAAAQLLPVGSIRPLMYSTLFGLLAAAGMRISEALALQLEDVTPDGLIVRQTKFQKSRLLPLHDTTRRALDEYLSVRLRLGTLDHALLVSTSGKAPAYHTVAATFRSIARSIGLRGKPGQPGPRIHDLRQNAESRKMPSDGAWALILASLRIRRSALSPAFYRVFRNLRSSSGGRKRACLAFNGVVLASAASLRAR